MSRCFPYPPPGFEKKPRSDHVDFLTKEKHKEKKHKKDKKDKEKRKDKKEKDRSKGKHKEKKDRKEKHRDKKKDNERDKDASKSSDERKTSLPIAPNHEQAIEERSEDIKDSIFMQELDKRIRNDEKGAAKRMVEIFPSMVVQRKPESTDSGVAIGGSVQDSTVQKGLEAIGIGSANLNSIHRRNEKHGLGIAVVGLSHKRDESMGAKYGSTIPFSQPMEATAVETFAGLGQKQNEFAASIQKRTDGFNAGTTLGASVRKKAENINAGTTFPGAAEKRVENVNNVLNKVVSLPKRVDNVLARFEKEEVVQGSANAAERRNNGVGSPMEKDQHRKLDVKEKINEKLQKRMENVVNAASMEKGMVTGKELRPAPACTDERNCNKLGQPIVEKSTEKKIETSEKSKEKRSKEKDKSRHKSKKEKGEKQQRHKEKDKTKDLFNKVVVDTIRTTLAPLMDTEMKHPLVDGNIKKRKGAEVNGFLHENDTRTNKLPRPSTTFAHVPQENGRIPELTYFVSHAPLNHVIPNEVKAEKHLDNKDVCGINGVCGREKEPTLDSKPSTIPSASWNGEASTRRPHPDTKYLSRIYEVPKLDERPQHDEQEWLFSNSNPRPRSNPKPLDDTAITSEVWSTAMNIGSEGVIAMPYVIPF